MIWFRYMTRETYRWIALVALIVFAFDFLISFVDKSSNIGRGNMTSAGMVIYLLMLLPSKAYDYFLGVTLIGTMLALARLAGQSEIVAAQACGLSPRRLMLMMAVIAVPLVLLVTSLGESFAPEMRMQAEEFRVSLRYPEHVKPSAGQLWFKHDDHFIYVGRVLTDSDLADIEWYELDSHNQLYKRVTAKKGTHLGNNRWRLMQVKEEIVSEKENKITQKEQLEIENWLKPELLKPFVLEPGALSTKELWQYAQYLTENQLDATFYTLTAYKRILYPLTLWLLFALIVPLVFGLPRGQSLASHVFFGVALGFGYLLLSELATHAALALGLLPSVAAGFPPAVIFSLLGINYVRQKMKA